jgi:hypothetical protein
MGTPQISAGESLNPDKANGSKVEMIIPKDKITSITILAFCSPFQ